MKITRTFVRIAGVVMLMVLAMCCQLTLAQSVGRTLTGTVQDASHEPLRGAVVQVETDGTGNVMSYITDQHGTFVFKRLSKELDYRVWATYKGQKSKVSSMSHFDSKPEKQIDLVITPD